MGNKHGKKARKEKKKKGKNVSSPEAIETETQKTEDAARVVVPTENDSTTTTAASPNNAMEDAQKQPAKDKVEKNEDTEVKEPAEKAVAVVPPPAPVTNTKAATEPQQEADEESRLREHLDALVEEYGNDGGLTPENLTKALGFQSTSRFISRLFTVFDVDKAGKVSAY